MNKWKDKKVAVLMGGMSREREISLRTGSAISKAMTARGYDVIDVDVTDGFSLVDILRKERPDVAVVALHGKFGEDGCVQGLLEMLRIPYTGSGVLASSVAMDKVVCLELAKGLGIPSADGFLVNASEIDSPLSNRLFSPPMVVKPVREGSTINVTIVDDESDLISALKEAARSDDRILVEKYIEGVEVTVGVLNGRALSVLEIAPKDGFYDYESKYTKGKTEYIVPARIDEGVALKLQEWSVNLFNSIECSGIARADFIVPPVGDPCFLEINTIPGMTELSLVPMAAAHMGLSFEDVCEELLSGASLKINV
jgi:D-alanine-D-alanine ligase